MKIFLNRVAVVVMGVVLMFMVGSVWIGQGVKERCELARGKYRGDCVEALMAYLEDEENSLEERNKAVWALGQIGDRRAKDLVEKYYYSYEIWGKKCEHDKYLCQRELAKTVRRFRGEMNAVGWVWKKIIRLD